MAVIARTLAGIKSDPLSLIGGADRINTLFTQVGHVWRDRLLDPATTLKLFILQVLHGSEEKVPGTFSVFEAHRGFCGWKDRSWIGSETITVGDSSSPDAT